MPYVAGIEDWAWYNLARAGGSLPHMASSLFRPRRSALLDDGVFCFLVGFN
jgi:hypothetical protein